MIGRRGGSYITAGAVRYGRGRAWRQTYRFVKIPYF